MTVKECVLKHLINIAILGVKPDYEKIAADVRLEMNSRTSVGCIAWYASTHKQEIQQAVSNVPVSEIILTDAEIEQQADVAINMDNNPEEIDNWESAEDRVVAYEESRGWTAKKITDPSQQNLKGYDVESIGPNGEVRHIEVKSKKGKKFTWLQLTSNETAKFCSDPTYFIYLVEGDCLNPNAEINIAEVSREELIKMAMFKNVARFSRLSGIERKAFKSNSAVEDNAQAGATIL